MTSPHSNGSTNGQQSPARRDPVRHELAARVGALLRSQGILAWRVSAHRPCPVCGKRDWCLLEPGRGRIAVCQRRENDFPLGSAGFVYLLHEAKPENLLQEPLPATDPSHPTSRKDTSPDRSTPGARERLRRDRAYRILLEHLVGQGADRHCRIQGNQLSPAPQRPGEIDGKCAAPIAPPQRDGGTPLQEIIADGESFQPSAAERKVDSGCSAVRTNEELAPRVTPLSEIAPETKGKASPAEPSNESDPLGVLLGLPDDVMSLLGPRLAPPAGSNEMLRMTGTLVIAYEPDTFRDVPGFRIVDPVLNADPDEPFLSTSTSLELAFPRSETVVFPSRAADGLIEGLRLKLLTPAPDGPRYTWFSFPEDPAKPKNRMGKSLPCAVYRGPDPRAIIVTEGEKKAAAATVAYGYSSISIPGVTLHAGTVDELDELDPAQEAVVLIAFDSDLRTNLNVRRELKKLAGRLSKLGRRVEALTWAPAYGKGIDDVLLSIGTQGITRTSIGSIVSERPENSPTPPIVPNSADREPTDLGNAARLIRDHGVLLRFVWAWQSWLVWDTTRWEVSAARAREAAKLMAREIYKEAAQLSDPAEQMALLKWARTSQNKQRLDAALWTAASDPRILAPVDALDADPWILNVHNGTVDLLTGELKPHDRNKLCTRLAPVPFDPSATCPTWHAFLHRIFAGDEDLIRFIQRAVGYSLTGHTSEQCVFIAWGEGANGKSTLLNTLAHVLGDYASEAAPETFTEQRRQAGQASPEIARLRGARFVTTIETGEGQRLHEALVKSATGGEKLTTRQLYGEFFEFTPAFKIWLATNHKPAIRGTDEGIWRRLRLIPFQVTIPESERDKGLPFRLLREASGILNWAIQGCLEWQRDGLSPPESVRAATHSYRLEQDALGRFLSERCVFAKHLRTPAQKLWSAWESWCREEGENVNTQNWFGRQLNRRQELKKVRMGTPAVNGYEGVGIAGSSEVRQGDLASSTPTQLHDLHELHDQGSNFRTENFGGKLPYQSDNSGNSCNSHSGGSGGGGGGGVALQPEVVEWPPEPEDPPLWMPYLREWLKTRSRLNYSNLQPEFIRFRDWLVRRHTRFADCNPDSKDLTYALFSDILESRPQENDLVNGAPHP